MNQTSHAAALLVPIAASCGVFGMLTVFGMASRTPHVPIPRRSAVAAVPTTTPVEVELGAGSTLVSQRGASTPVA